MVEQASSSDGDSTSDDEYSASKNAPVAGQGKMAARANPGRRSNMILLQDSKFSAGRTDMRLWHELRYVRSLWSREEEDQLRNDCLAIIDGVELQSTSNSILWTASFDRYGVPLSDIFTYGLRPHPGTLRLSRKKLLSPHFCDHLTSVMVHPIFQGDAALLRYVLQLIVCKRVGMHVPPMGTMPDMDDASLDRVKFLADTLLLEEETPEARLLVHADAYLFISQKHGARFRPDIVMLEDLLNANFSNEGYDSTAPRDDAPNSRSLFYLQLWDLQFLLNVLDGLSVGSSYLITERYKTWWLKDTYRIQKYIATKLGSLVQQWFLSDERNYRIRQKSKQQDSDTRLYDIPEEDFNPTYTHSQYVTHQMRAVLEGDYLEALCPPDSPERHLAGDPVFEVPIAVGSVSGGSNFEDSTAESSAIREEEPGSGSDAAQSPFNLTHSPQDSPVRRIEDDSGNTIKVDTHDDQQAFSEAQIKLETQTDFDNKIDHQNGDYGGAFDGDVEDIEGGKGQAHSRRETSFVSIQSVASSKAADGQPHSPCGSPAHRYFARRGLPSSD